jgi:hypothetical protein
LGSVNRADIRTSAALDAFFGIDDILAVAFGNRFRRAFRRAGTAADAGIVNYIGHLQSSLRTGVFQIVERIDKGIIAEINRRNKKDFDL